MRKKRRRPTNKEIEREVARLREMKPRVRHFSAFGDDHWAAIDAQIAVLDDCLDEDELYEAYPMPDEECPAPDNVRHNAERALWWRDGSENYCEKGPPSKEWEELVQRIGDPDGMDRI